MEREKVVPYQTSTGIKIGCAYQPKPLYEHSKDMDLLQQALLGDRKGWIANIAKDIAATTAAIVFLILIILAAR